jgi:uncharacterized MAPEG superfamily protein
MRWPLELFALLIVLLHLLQSFLSADAGWKRAAEVTRHVFIPFAAVAVLMIALGKPGLPAQYSAWAILVLQLVCAFAAQRQMARVEKVTYWLSLALVGLIWIVNLPLFDAIPS